MCFFETKTAPPKSVLPLILALISKSTCQGNCICVASLPLKILAFFEVFFEADSGIPHSHSILFFLQSVTDM